MTKFLLLFPMVVAIATGQTTEDLEEINEQVIEPIAGFIFYRVQNGTVEYLLMKKPHKDDWSPPKGNAEPNETLISTANRETREETGWLVSIDYQVYTQSEYKIYFEYETKYDVLKQVHLWPGRLTNFEKPLKLSAEHSEYTWLEYAEAVAIIKRQYRVALTRGDTIVKAFKLIT